MGIKLGDLQKATRILNIDFQGEAVELEYYVNVVTTAFLREELTESEQLARMVKRWDVLDDEGRELAVSAEVIDQLPYQLRAKLTASILDDMRGHTKEEKKSS
jgi:hypothetical protein